jgi:hypothetical protein
MNTQTLTQLEKEVLEGINNSNYGDELGCAIWSWSIKHPTAGTKVISGVVSSLSKKGLTGHDGRGDDQTIWLTEEGMKVCRELNLLGKYK